jgi:hypothetical protein
MTGRHTQYRDIWAGNITMNVGLNVALTPYFGLVGAAISAFFNLLFSNVAI